ncbi:MAG: hypothetical protein QM791_03095 [Ferruginibacter sp.]
MRNNPKHIKQLLVRTGIIALLFLTMQYCASAQDAKTAYTIKDGKMFIMVNKKIDSTSLDNFITNYNLDDLDLKNIIRTNIIDTLQKLGWAIELNNSAFIAISKKLGGVVDFSEPSASINVSVGRDDNINDFPAISSKVKYGLNQFKNKWPFTIRDSVVTFFLRGNTNANKVILAGSFNNWSTSAQRMTATDSGWIADIKLGPGKYWYKFIIDGKWDIDRDNKLVENDGRGNDNSVFFKPNYVFRSHSFLTARKLFIAGSFNNWNPNELQFTRTNDGWILPMYLAEGTHTYRLIADGRWSEDPENDQKFPNEFGEYNSVIRFGKSYVFRLDGFINASKIVLLGSFNNWKDNELFMSKASNGWDFSYAIGAGNYEYSFKVDGRWVTGDSNRQLTNTAADANYFNLILSPNYTFRLKGFDSAKEIFIAGDFNNWSPNTFPLTRTADGWMISIHLDKGKHRYKFIVDGKWIRDPDNSLWEQNEHGNSVLWIE